eukprot:4857733-Amphidinium_carterae.1
MNGLVRNVSRCDVRFEPRKLELQAQPLWHDITAPIITADEMSQTASPPLCLQERPAQVPKKKIVALAKVDHMRKDALLKSLTAELLGLLPLALALSLCRELRLLSSTCFDFASHQCCLTLGRKSIQTDLQFIAD